MSGQVSSVYLRFDRTYYIPGESMFFKAYFSDDKKNLTVTENDSLHLVILDQDGLVVSSDLFPVSNNMITGTVELPDILTEGNYMVVGYTNSMKNLSPDKMFSRLIEIRKSVENYLMTKLSLTESSYDSGSMLTAQLRFSGNENNPVPASFTYQLNGQKEEILNGNNKANNEGLATLKLRLPKFDSKETLKLIVVPSYKGTKNITAVIIPTQYNIVNNKTSQEKNQSSGLSKHLNIQLKPSNLSSEKNTMVTLDITVTDDLGAPVIANLTISASNNVPTRLPSQNDNILNFSNRKSDPANTVFNTDVNEFFTSHLIQLTQSPGSPFIVQEKNNAKKLRKRKIAYNQKYSAMNSVGVIEITTKKSPEILKNETNARKVKSSTLYWGPDIMTDNTGKATINFSKNDSSPEVIISVDGMAASGVCGSSSVIVYQNGK
jgi:hypothetical protein